MHLPTPARWHNSLRATLPYERRHTNILKHPYSGCLGGGNNVSEILAKINTGQGWRARDALSRNIWHQRAIFFSPLHIYLFTYTPLYWDIKLMIEKRKYQKDRWINRYRQKNGQIETKIDINVSIPERYILQTQTSRQMDRQIDIYGCYFLQVH